MTITTDSISAANPAAGLGDDFCGAVVTFQGFVRADGPADNPLVALEFSARDADPLEPLRRLRRSALEQFAIRDVAITQRVGRLAVGETPVAIAVAAAHRDAAFDACRWIIDQLKREMPFRKKEIWSRGEPTWVEPQR